MKKLVLLSAVLFGTAVASQAGVRLDIGIGFPFPHHERVIVSRPAPVYVEPYCEPAPRVYYAPPQYYAYPSHYGYGHSSRGHHGGYSEHHRGGSSHHGGHSSRGHHGGHHR